MQKAQGALVLSLHKQPSMWDRMFFILLPSLEQGSQHRSSMLLTALYPRPPHGARNCTSDVKVPGNMTLKASCSASPQV